MCAVEMALKGLPVPVIISFHDSDDRFSLEIGDEVGQSARADNDYGRENPQAWAW